MKKSNNQIEITIQFFGALRKYTKKDGLFLTLPRHSSVSDIRSALVPKLRKHFPDFNNDGLLDSSVFANESKILNENAKFKTDTTLTILPPVCGG